MIAEMRDACRLIRGRGRALKREAQVLKFRCRDRGASEAVPNFWSQDRTR
jgi:hypothetical protein